MRRALPADEVNRQLAAELQKHMQNVKRTFARRATLVLTLPQLLALGLGLEQVQPDKLAPVVQRDLAEAAAALMRALERAAKGDRRGAHARSKRERRAVTTTRANKPADARRVH